MTTTAALSSRQIEALRFYAGQPYAPPAGREVTLRALVRRGLLVGNTVPGRAYVLTDAGRDAFAAAIAAEVDEAHTEALAEDRARAAVAARVERLAELTRSPWLAR